MRATLPYLESTDFPDIKRSSINTLQINIGYLCNQSCLHCHVNAGPRRTEVMNKETIDQVLAFIDREGVKNIDITGGAPELNPHFRYLVKEAFAMGLRIINRCNLTVLLEPGQEDTIDFLARHKVEIIASLPCYLKDNVDNQRGEGVYDKSISALKKLNQAGYGKKDTGLILDFMFNPVGPVLPPEQASLEQDYKRELKQNHDIEFNRLYTLVNMPIQRFGSTLISKGKFSEYMDLLKLSHRENNIDSVMCRSLVSIDWQGYLYDCDFNQMLGMPINVRNTPAHISNIDIENLKDSTISIGDHCYGCTAGNGSSCGGAFN
ncbi:MAG: arsenosugar biosynthesis radical SAM protein ArsS [Gammaproteobacteria bacterium]|nr:arsenosugar biosynthesis radical SAM protein ArsS [Gammaproteobacteria bacterium]